MCPLLHDDLEPYKPQYNYATIDGMKCQNKNKESIAFRYQYFK
jgi:hypothetical protein